MEITIPVINVTDTTVSQAPHNLDIGGCDSHSRNPASPAATPIIVEAPAGKLAFRPTRLLQAICEDPWAIQLSKFYAILDLVQLRALGFRADAETIAFWQSQAKPQAQQGGAVAVLPIFGTISNRMNIMSDFSGATSTEKFGKMFDMAIADKSVKTVVLDVNSPGGTIYGVDELSAKIFKARSRGRQIIAMVNPLAASAAYWIASAADEISMTPTGEVGSIGVYAAHVDQSQMNDMMGMKTTLISAGKYKVEGNPFQPLSKDAQENMQARVDEYYQMFLKAVARNRGTTMNAVEEGYGQGRTVSAKQAMKLGMIDRMETMDELLGRLGVGKSTPVGMAAEELETPTQAVSEMRRRRLRLMETV